jgi:hypothetical protein
MAFWSDTSIAVPEPKRNYRWLCYLGNIAEPWVCKTVNKPSYSISEAEHSYINHKFFYPGRIEWSTVEVTLVDPSSPDVVQGVYNALGEAGYVPPMSSADTLTLSKAAGVAALGQVRIQQIGDQFSGTADSSGSPILNQQEVLEEWILYNAWIKEVKFGDLDYTNDDLTEVSLTFRYDFARLNGDNPTGVIGDKSTFGAGA